MSLFRSASLVVLCSLTACGVQRGICESVICEKNRVCDPMTGGCIGRDGGFVDAGTPDAGAPDAGRDAGAPDAGRDAGVDAGIPCVAGCGDAGQVCDTFSGSCVQCLTNAQCACPAALCDRQTRTCVTNLPDAGTQPIGDSCADAPLISFPVCASSRTTFRVDLGKLADDVQGTCSAATGLGRDAVFVLRVANSSDVKVTTTRAPGSTAQPVTYLRMSPCPTGAELVCHDTFGNAGSFRAKAVPAGDYALVIDAYDQLSSGAVDVTVELLPTVTNDTCATPLDALTDGGTVTVDLSGALDDLTATCSSSGPDSREAVYQVTLTERSDFNARVIGLRDSGADPVLYLRGSPCSDAGVSNQLACVDQTFADEPELLRARGLKAGTYFLVVEGFGAAGSAPVSLTSWATPLPNPANDTCAAPRPLNFQGGSFISVPVDTSEADDDDRGSCSIAGGGREAVLTFTLAAPRTVTITSASADGGSAVDPVIYLRAGGCAADAGVELGCADDTSFPEVLTRTLAAGTYFLFVDSYTSSTAGPTVVTVTLQ